MSSLAYNHINAENEFTLYTIQDNPIEVLIDEGVEDGLLTYHSSSNTIKNTAIGTSYLYYLSQS